VGFGGIYPADAGNAQRIRSGSMPAVLQDLCALGKNVSVSISIFLPNEQKIAPSEIRYIGNCKKNHW